ncbi:MAG: ATP-binding protein [Cryomorphaceae bacterium]|nr:ATP-binding protein [Flavobacteriales bacterium]
MIKRIASAKLKELASYYTAVAVIGPRQSGKTTLVRSLFPEKDYLTLENPDQRQYATDDPRGFLSQYPDGAVLDEIQNVPELFSYLQQVIDEDRRAGKFILTGSNNFLLQEGISQSLAGRVGYLELLPLSTTEMGNLASDNDNELMVKGFYPPIYDRGIPADVWYNDYRRTYLERDVRQIKAITRFGEFERLLRLMAGRVAQELNYTALSVEVGVDVKTIQEWTSVLEQGFIIYRMRPYHKNYNKTIVKRPKLYFYDTGLACSLLGIKEADQLTNHPTRGAIFENMVVGDAIKHFTHRGERPELYYWRDKTGREVDLIAERAGKLLPIEIKSGMTFQEDFSKHLKTFMKLSGVGNAWVLYGGREDYSFSTGIKAMNWRKIEDSLGSQS